MRKFFLLFFTILIFFILSCAGTPKPDISAPDITDEKIDEVSQTGLSHIDEPVVDEVSDNENESDDTDDNTAGEIYDTDLREQSELAVEEIPDTEPAPDEDAPVIHTASVIDFIPAREPEMPPESLPPEPLAQQPVTPQPVIVPEPETELEPERTPPSLPRQPPSIPSPALLGPAEEKPSTVVREEAPPRREPEMDSPVVSSVRESPSAVLQPVPPDGDYSFSRTVRATAGQIVEIPFRGRGWIFIGELASRRGIVYNSRRLDPEGQTFIFKAEEAGTYVLKFFREDFINDYILNDHVQVIVGQAPSSGTGWFNPPVDYGRVVAEPRWPVEHQPAGRLQTDDGSNEQPVAQRDSIPDASSAGETAVSDTPPEGENLPAQEFAVTQPPEAESRQNDALSERRLSPEEILQKARETFDSGNVAAAIALLDQFREYYPSGSDEVYWLYGQFYEANSPERDVLLALDYYRRLVNEYPQSSRYNDARRRIAYLERFYINIQ